MKDSKNTINRLVDMVVEEVSLVDRAANQHRFLIVKRSDPMNPEAQKSGEKQPAAGVGFSPSLLAVAVSALEGLTEAVEVLSANGGDPPRLTELAAELQALASKLAGEESDNAPSTTASEDAQPTSAVESIRATLARVTTLVNEATASASDGASPESGAPKASENPAVADQLADVAKALRALTTTVQAQQQRIAQVEKRFGMPNSSRNDERPKPAAAPAVGWPMDMNNPMDRESVDKSVSFHDV